MVKTYTALHFVAGHFALKNSMAGSLLKNNMQDLKIA